MFCEISITGGSCVILRMKDFEESVPRDGEIGSDVSPRFLMWI